MSDSFPRQYARTGRFTFGAPRDFRVADGGSRVLFLRSGSGDDPANRLWCFDAHSGTERLLVDPAAALAGADPGDLPAAERARRERAREGAGGIVAFDADGELTTAVFALAGRLFRVDVGSGALTELSVTGAAFDPRLDPTGQRVGYVTGNTLRCTGEGGDREVASEEDPTISWGSAEFVAAEEMHRMRGYWWSPDGRRLVACRVDVTPVATWYLASPTTPWSQPRAMRYPAAGTANASVELVIVGLDGATIPVDWSQGRYEYLCDVTWSNERLTVVAQTRDQREVGVLVVDPGSGAAEAARLIQIEPWVELVPGSPRWHDGRLVTAEDVGATRRVMVDGEPLGPADFQVRRLVDVRDDGVWVVGTADPTEAHVARIRWDGNLEMVTTEPGVHSVVLGGPTAVLVSQTADRDGVGVVVSRDGQPVGSIDSFAEVPAVAARPEFAVLGRRELRGALLLPSRATDGLLPVLLDPYGGPHALRVQRSRSLFLTSQWFADQGFAVLVADGRGTPARGPAWEFAVHHDLATAVLEDQVDALHAAAERYPQLDLTRVAVRGWSFGGYLAALAVLRRPDVFHAAVAGAPVTDWRLYDTHYTERYLGNPAVDDAPYAASDLCAEAASLTRPLMLIHGLADDNVVAAHTLKFSQALLEAGRPHEVLPLSDVTHMTPQEQVAENLLLLQLDFLRRSLPIPDRGERGSR